MHTISIFAGVGLIIVAGFWAAPLDNYISNGVKLFAWLFGKERDSEDIEETEDFEDFENKVSLHLQDFLKYKA